MKQDDKWSAHYQEVMEFMDRKRRRPSKNFPEDRNMLNWIKYNKKRMSSGKMEEERRQLFEELLKKADDFRRLNQYVYGHPNCENPALATQLSLF